VLCLLHLDAGHSGEQGRPGLALVQFADGANVSAEALFMRQWSQFKIRLQGFRDGISST
jgi:hypothetical protein